MRILIYGAGAMGSLFGARLAAAGHSVTLVGRPAHVEAIRAQGLRVEGDGAGTFWPEATDQLRDGDPPEGILLTVKGFDLVEAASQIARHYKIPIPILLSQNGLGVEERVLSGLVDAGWPREGRKLVRFVHSVPATLVGPGIVRAAGRGTILLPEGTPEERGGLAPWVELLASMGYPVELRADFSRALWEKLLVNAAINPVTADHGILNVRLLDDPWRGQALALLEEARRIAGRCGVDIPAEEAEARLWSIVRATARNRSSMLQDLERGRPTEIETISGGLVELARSFSERVPATQRALDRIRARVRERHSPTTEDRAFRRESPDSHLPPPPVPEPPSGRDRSVPPKAS
jgi:2-dehydropantoate 2-reductase